MMTHDDVRDFPAGPTIVRQVHGGSPVPTSKLASALAEKICVDIEARGWEPGTLLSNESELIEKYDASRAVVRETIGLLEYRGAVEVRRGRSGGVFIGELPDEITVRVMTTHLKALDVTSHEIFEARQLVEGLAIALASSRIGEVDARRLRDHVEQTDPFDVSLDFHDAIAEVSRNPLVSVTAKALRRVLQWGGPGVHEPCDDSRTTARHVHQEILDAVIGGDSPGAVNLMRRHLDAFQTTVDTHQPIVNERDHERWRTLTPAVRDGERLAPRLARFIVAETRGRPVGESLGSEPSLLERYQVSRAVLRETVRILEYDGVAEMRKGPRGGLILLAPNRHAATVEFDRYASFLKLSATQVAEFMTAIELGCLDLTMERLDATGRETLQRALDYEHDVSNSEFNGSTLHLVLTELSQNRVLEFIYAALRRTLLKRLYADGSQQMRFFVPHARGAHDGIIAAILSGDRPVARLLMREHIVQASAMFAPHGQPLDLTPQLGQFLPRSSQAARAVR